MLYKGVPPAWASEHTLISVSEFSTCSPGKLSILLVFSFGRCCFCPLALAGREFNCSSDAPSAFVGVGEIILNSSDETGRLFAEECGSKLPLSESFFDRLSDLLLQQHLETINVIKRNKPIIPPVMLKPMVKRILSKIDAGDVVIVLLVPPEVFVPGDVLLGGNVDTSRLVVVLVLSSLVGELVVPSCTVVVVGAEEGAVVVV